MKRAIGRAIASVAPPLSGGGVRVLMYHAVGHPVAGDALALHVPQSRFLEQMQVLRDDGYRVVPLSAAVSPPPDDGRTSVAITFDDGHSSDAWVAGVLREFGFPATFFVVPRFLDGLASPSVYWEAWPHLSWDDAAALSAAGFDLAAHSATHLDLRTCGDARLDDEVAGARTALTARLGVPIPHFSYPFGRHDARVRGAVERAGYQLACTSRYGLNRTGGPRYSVNRTEVTGTDDLRSFRRKLQGRYDWLAPWQDPGTA